MDAEGARVLLGWVLRDNTFFQSYKNIYLTGFNQCTIAQIRIKLTAEVDIESVAQNDDVSNKELGRQAASRF